MGNNLIALAIVMLVSIEEIAVASPLVIEPKVVVQKDYFFNWEPPKNPLSIQVFVGKEDKARVFASEIEQSGIKPVFVSSIRQSEMKKVSIGAFQTMLEADAVSYELKSKFPETIITSVNSFDHSVNTRLSSYENITTGSSIVAPSSLFFDDENELDYPTTSSQLLLEQIKRDLLQDVTPDGIAQAIKSIKSFETTSTIKHLAIEFVAKIEMEKLGKAQCLLAFTDDFCKGKIEFENSDDYWRFMLYIADATHEFTKNHRLAVILYKAVLDGIPNVYRSPNPLRVRAIVELSALSREVAEKGIGSFGGTPYWKWRYKMEFSPVYKRASAVMDLIMLENYKKRNTNVLITSKEVQDDFLKECALFHSSYHAQIRERIFLYNMQMGIAVHRTSAEVYEIADRAYSIHSTSLFEHGQWAGRSINFLPGIIRVALDEAIRNNDENARDKYAQMLKSAESFEGHRVFDPHIIFEKAN